MVVFPSANHSEGYLAADSLNTALERLTNYSPVSANLGYCESLRIASNKSSGGPEQPSSRNMRMEASQYMSMSHLSFNVNLIAGDVRWQMITTRGK